MGTPLNWLDACACTELKPLSEDGGYAEVYGRASGSVDYGSTDFVDISPDGSKLVSLASSKSTMTLWDPGVHDLFALKQHDLPKADACCLRAGPTNERLLARELHTNQVKCLAILGDGPTVVTASWDKSIKLWNPGEQGLGHERSEC